MLTNIYVGLFLTACALTPTSLLAQSSPYDPPTTQTFTQATAGMAVVDSFKFGTAFGNNISNLSQLAAKFNPYGISNTTVIHDEWERYQPFNPQNFVFEPHSLNLTATIPAATGGLFPGGINSGQIWSKQTWQPAVTGHNVYAISVLMKIPGGTGMWPAAWLYSPTSSDGSENDLLEVFMMQYQNQYDWTGFDHGPGAGTSFWSLLSNPWTWHPGIDFSAAPHQFQEIWTPDATYKYFDGTLIYAQLFRWTSPQPAQLGINLAVGSSSSALPGLIPNALAEFPAAIQLQSITIWAR